MSEEEGKREAILRAKPRMGKAVLPKPSGVVFADDTLRGKVRVVGEKAKQAYGKYFKGSSPLVPTSTELKKE